MKLAVSNNIGVQDPESMVQNYYLVTDNYDFVANEASDVTTVFSAIVLYMRGKIDYIQARECLKTKYKIQANWDLCDDDEKRALVNHFVFPTGTDLNFFSYSDYQLFKFEDTMLDKYVGVRSEWINLLRKYIYRYYKPNVPAQFSIQAGISTKYADFIQGANPEIIYWFQGIISPLTGVDYSTTGYPTKSYYNSNFQNNALSILLYGIDNSIII